MIAAADAEGNRPRSKGFLHDVLVLAGGTAFGQALLMLATPIIVRLYRPADYGVFAVFLSFALTWSMVGCLRFEPAVVIPRADDDAADVLWLCLTSLAAMVTVAALALAAFGTSIASVLHTESTGWLWAVPPYVFAAGLSQALGFWSTRRQHFSAVSISRVLTSAIVILTQIAAAVVFHAGASGLIIGSMVGQLAGAVVLAFIALRTDSRLIIGAIRRGAMWQTARTYRNFPIYSAPYSFVGVFGKRLVVVLLSAYAGTAAAGYYEFASKLVYFPITLVGGALNQVFFPRAAAQFRSPALGPFVIRIQTLTTLAVGPIFVAGALQAPVLFGRIFGPAWTPSGDYAVALCLPAFMVIVTSWLDRLYDVMGRQRMALIMECSYNLVSLGLFAGVLLYSRNGLYATYAYCAATFFYNILWLVITFPLVGFRVSHLGRVALASITGIATVGVVHVAVGLARSALASLIADTAIAIALPVGVIWVLRSRGSTIMLGANEVADVNVAPGDGGG